MTPPVDEAEALFDVVDAALASLDRAERSLAEICTTERAMPRDGDPPGARLDLWALRLPEAPDPVATPPFGIPDLAALAVPRTPRPEPVSAPGPLPVAEPVPGPGPLPGAGEDAPRSVQAADPRSAMAPGALPSAEPVAPPTWEDVTPIRVAQMESPPQTALVDQALRWTHDHPVQMRRIIAGTLASVAVIAALAAVVAPGGRSQGGPARAVPATAIDPELVRVATATLPLVDVFDSPTQSAAAMTLAHPTPNGGPLVFVVEGDWEGWYKVRLPVAPAGGVGWIRSAGVDVREHRTRITIELGSHLLTARADGKIILRTPVALGRQDQPKPGTTFVAARVDLGADPGTYGSRALTLAGYGNGPETLFRGTGLVGIHGVGDPLSLGQTVRRGSVGVADDDVARLYELVPPGTPVVITG